MAVERGVEAERQKQKSQVIIIAEHCTESSRHLLLRDKITRLTELLLITVVFQCSLRPVSQLWLMRLFCSFSAFHVLLEHKTLTDVSAPCNLQETNWHRQIFRLYPIKKQTNMVINSLEDKFRPLFKVISLGPSPRIKNNK